MLLRAVQNPTRGKAMLSLAILRADGSFEEIKPVPNSRLDSGALWVFNQLTGQGSPGPGIYIAFSEETQSIVKGMTALSSEISGGELSRSVGNAQNYNAPGSLDGAANYELTKTFTYTSITSKVISAVGIFDASSSGSLIWVFNVAPSKTVNLNDRVIPSVAVNI